jgi:choline dehydrogenase-like flavoprotein
MKAPSHDYDWLVIGSGFGGSASALRLAAKGYRVNVLECGRRYAEEDFAKTTWEAAKHCWMPKLGLKGVLRLTLFKDVFVACRCGVGGSLGYANTLYRARAALYKDPQIEGPADWELSLRREHRRRRSGAPINAPAERALRTALELPIGEARPASGVGQRHGAGGTRKHCRQQSLLFSRWHRRRDLHMHPYRASRTRRLDRLSRLLYGRGGRG